MGITPHDAGNCFGGLSWFVRGDVVHVCAAFCR